MSLGNNDVNKCKLFDFDLNVAAVDDANYDSPDNLDLCSICLKFLINNIDERRTLVTLKCDHKFHFDCLGTTFNATSLMQCPKCMHIEPGQWRYATSLQNLDLIAEEDETIQDYSIEMTMGIELCPHKALDQHNSSGNTNLVDEAISSNEPVEQSQACLYIEYSFTIPQSSAAVVAQNFSFSSQLTTGVEQVPNPNRKIFWSISEPGVMTGRHYIAHPYLDHGRIPDSLSNLSGSNQVNDDGSIREEVDPYMELSEQFQIERDQLYIMIGGHENGNQGGSVMNGGSSGAGNSDGPNGNGINGGGEN